MISLDLDKNNLQGNITAGIANLSNLQTLYLSNNQFSGVLTTGFSALTNLKTISLAGNKFSGDFFGALANSSLTTLNIASNRFAGQLPSDLGQRYPGLTTFVVTGNLFTGAVPTSLTTTPMTYRFLIDSNYFNRDSLHQAFMSGSLLTWYTNLSAQKTRNNQGDVIAPVIAGSGTLGVTTGPVSYQLIVQENSYAIAHTGSAVAASGEGMPVTVS